MSVSRTENLENPFAPKQVATGIYKAESYTADGEKIDLYMELLTDVNVDAWNTYRMRAGSIAEELKSVISLDSSKWRALCEVPRGAYAKNFSKREYVVYAIKRGSEHTLLPTSADPDNIEDFKRDYSNILMTVDADFVHKVSLFGHDIHKISYENRGIFRNPVSIIENTHKGLAMILHGFSAAVARKFFPEKLYLEVSPIASMQHILYHSLPREAFFNNEESYNQIKIAAATMTGSEVVNNVIKTEMLSQLYFHISAENEITASNRQNSHSVSNKSL